MQTTTAPSVLLLDLPPQSFAGINLLSFTTTDRFQGIKNLPAGWHFVFASTTSALSVRHGIWFHIDPEDAKSDQTGAGAVNGASKNQDDGGTTATRLQLFIARWDAATETLVAVQEPTEVMRWRANLGSLWKERLFPYRQHISSQPNDESSDSTGDGGEQSSPGAVTAISRIRRESLHDEGRAQAEADAEAESTKQDEWIDLTKHISAAMLDRVLGRHYSASHNGTQTPFWALSSASSALGDADDLDKLIHPDDTRNDISKPQALDPEIQSQSGNTSERFAEKELRFLPIDLRRTWPMGATGRQRTDAARDRSWALNALIRSLSSSTSIPLPKDMPTRDAEEDDAAAATQILGELQLTFLTVATLNNFSCMEQWKRILGLLLTCRHAAVTLESSSATINSVSPTDADAAQEKGRANLIANALTLLTLQLRRAQDVAEGGLFDLSEQGAGLLIQLLRRFKTGLLRTDGPESSTSGKPERGRTLVLREFAALEAYVQEEFGWRLDDRGILKRGLVELEDGERVELEVEGVREEEDAEGEAGEYAPVVVELSEEMRTELGLRDTGGTVADGGKVQEWAYGKFEDNSADESEEESEEEMDYRY